MRSFSFNEMIPQLLFVTGSGDSHSIVQRIQLSSQNAALSEIFLSGVHVDIGIFHALVDVLTRREWNGLHMAQCSGLISELIETSSPLVEKLSILGDFMRMDVSWCQSLSRGLQLPNTKLKKLMLRVQLSEDLANALQESMGSRHCKVEDLIVPISNSSASSIALLSSALRQSKSLKSLKLNRHDLVWTMDEYQVSTLIKSLKDHPSLKELSIQGSACTGFGITAISTHVVHSLQRLDLSNHRFGGDRLDGIQSLTQALVGSRPNALKYLSVSGHRLSEMDVECLADALSNDHSRMEELHMNHCNLDDDSLMIFAKRLPHMKRLKRLFLHDNPFGSNKSSVAATKALVDGTRKNWELEQLVLPRRAGQQQHQGGGTEELHQQIDFYLALNRAGRKLLRTKEHPIPLSLWPKVLHRVGDTLTEHYCSNSKSVHCADAIYHLLQGPALLQRC